MKQPRQPTTQLQPCPACFELCVGHVITGLCAMCCGDAARADLALRLRVLAGTPPPEVTK